MENIDIPMFPLEGSCVGIPAIGFGSGTKWRIRKASGETKDEFIDVLASQVTNALDLGFRHIDVAEAYKTHPEVGLGISNSCVPRDKIFLTDKYSPWSWDWRKGSGPLESLKLSLEKMNVPYVDLYLLHVPSISVENAGIDLKEAWRQMEQIYEKKLALNIGVSNFDVESLEYIKSFSKHQPVVNQIEFHAYSQQQTPGIIKYCKSNKILLAGYSPLVPITNPEPGPLDDILPKLAKKYGKTEAQILLRWVIQNEIVVITTSQKKERLSEYLKIFDFELSKEDFDIITKEGRKKIIRNMLDETFYKWKDHELYSDLE